MKLTMRFPGGKPKALTFSYDDGVYQDLRLIELFGRFGMKATFNLNSGVFADEPGSRTQGRMTREDTLAAYAGTGHEVAVHTFTHPHLERIPIEHAAQEVLRDRMRLEEMFGGIVRGGAYPFGTYSDDVVRMLRACGMCYFRTTQSTEDFTVPSDWLRMPATCHHKNPRLTELAQRFVTDSPDREVGWRRDPWLFYVWGHSYEFDRGEPGNRWEDIEQFCKAVGGRDDVWYATNLEIYDYVQAFRALRVSLDETVFCNPTAHTLFFEWSGEKGCIAPGQTKRMA